MSFTQEVKHEVANVELNACCQKAETAALIQLSSSVVIKNHKLELSIKTENATTAKRVFKLMKDLFQAEMKLSVMKKKKKKKNNIYEIQVLDKTTEILTELGLWNTIKTRCEKDENFEVFFLINKIGLCPISSQLNAKLHAFSKIGKLKST